MFRSILQEEKSENREYRNLALERAFQIVDLFDAKDGGLTLSEIAEAIDSKPGSLYSTVYVLRKYGYLKRDEDKKYTLGFEFLNKAESVLDSLDVRKESKPYLEELANSAEVNVHLAVLDNKEVMYLYRARGYQSVTIGGSIVGRRVPAYLTALGKVLLAFLPREKIDKYLEEVELEAYTPHTVTNVDKLREIIRKVKSRGYAIDREEFHEGVCCVAAPVRDHTGEVQAAVSLSLPKSRFQEEKYIKMTSKLANNVSRAIGFRKEIEDRDSS